ncbi:transmembrane emp24 domain-containing protein p24beta2-like protein [Cinnamomum micranthum f. kanehirae]|uniref:Transmembrane emp24 domain-containing protein p24beta2-like protein n=1 Tax=Cinnamomum micranthum f. kanehirae TaxID=337451 RepID=A0A443PW82_9MAGN|nr:transmembrane emp24 domain-containing protein p24beta2-like protein [Cinnamomum micranthum f. kanehirae]
MMKPPVVKKVKHEMVMFGDVRNDDYYWFHDNSRSALEVLSYLKEENAYTNSVMEESDSDPLNAEYILPLLSAPDFAFSCRLRFFSSESFASRGKEKKMEFHSSIVPIILLCLLSNLRSAIGIRFVIDREECFSHSVPYEGDTVQVSFVVIKADTWHYGEDGVDLVVKGPAGEQIHDSRDKTSDKFEFVVHKKGLHRFCFTNKSPYHETIDFDIHVGHFAHFDQHAKDEHFNPLLDQIAKLEEALYNVQFEQHWLEAQTDRQALSMFLILKLLFVSEQNENTSAFGYYGKLISRITITAFSTSILMHFILHSSGD